MSNPIPVNQYNISISSKLRFITVMSNTIPTKSNIMFKYHQKYATFQLCQSQFLVINIMFQYHQNYAILP